MISIPLHSTTNSYHLGNNDEVVDAKGVVQQVTNYYPFGAPYADATAVKNADFQPYKYNGKELDLMHGLNTYDYGARQHDPILARWDRIDPLCEKYYSTSPYVYCNNNPVKYIDPDGRFTSMWKAQFNHKFSEMEAKFTGCVVGDIVHDKNAISENGSYYYNKVSSDGEGGFVVTKVMNMSRDLADGLTNVGTGAEVVGYGLTLSGVGAEVGAPLAGAGATLSTVGTLTGIAIDAFNGDYKNAIKSGVFYTVGASIEKAIEKIPGCEDVAKEALKYGSDLKMKLAEKIFDTAEEKIDEKIDSK